MTLKTPQIQKKYRGRIVGDIFVKYEGEKKNTYAIFYIILARILVYFIFNILKCKIIKILQSKIFLIIYSVFLLIVKYFYVFIYFVMPFKVF